MCPFTEDTACHVHQSSVYTRHPIFLCPFPPKLISPLKGDLTSDVILVKKRLKGKKQHRHHGSFRTRLSQ
eukprot:scaffold59045_cov38-Cyclotella_meneghiniana.AAC.2